MSGPKDGAILNPVRLLFESGGTAGASDAELLERFVARGPGAESAFAALLDRHGPMVLAVCRRLAGDRGSADDAFQATWLALVRRAGSIRVRGSLAPWLFAVARRVALRARKRAARLRLAHPDAPEPIDPSCPADLAERADLSRVVFEEIGRLPERYRAPVVLCHVERRTHDEAARDLGWPVGTVRGRLARARRLLRDRLERRGVGLSIGAVLAGLRREATAAVSPALEAAVLLFVRISSTGVIASGALSTSVVALHRGAASMMTSTLWFASLIGTMGIGLAASGFVLPARHPQGSPDGARPPGISADDASSELAPPPGGSNGGGASPPELDPSGILMRSVDAHRASEDSHPGDGPGDGPGTGGRPSGNPGSGGSLADFFREIQGSGGTVAIEIELDELLDGDDRDALLALLNTPLTPAPNPPDYSGLTPQQALQEFLRTYGFSYRAEGKRITLSRYKNPGTPPARGANGPGDASAVDPSPMGRGPDGGDSPVRGTAAVVEEAVEPGDATASTFLVPTIEEVERLFAGKTFEAIEIESAINAWERLVQVDRGEGEPTEIDQFIDHTRKKLEARLSEFAQRPEDAVDELQRLQADLRRLLDLHIALVGPEGESAELLATQCLRLFASRQPIESVVEGGMLVRKPSVQRVHFFAQRVQSLFSQLGIELGPPVHNSGGMGFGTMGGMGGGGMF